MQRMLAWGPGQSSTAMQAESGSAPVILAHEQPFRIGEAEFRPATREVQFGGTSSVIEPRVMQVLVALHRAAGAVVSKDDLQSCCWEGRVVGEDAINRVLSRLRSVGEKQAGGQFRIETITKVGYRLIGANVAARDDAKIASTAPPGLRRRDLVIGASAVGAAAAAGIGWTILRGDPTPREARLLIADARMSLRDGAVDEVDNATSKLRRAAEIAPGSADAWGLLAFAYMVAANSAPSAERPGLRARGKTAIDRAFRLRADQPDAIAAQVLSMRLFRNWYAYETALRSALARNPDHAVLNCMLAYVLSQVGRAGEALACQATGLATFTLSPQLQVSRTFCLWDLGRLDEAEAAITRAFELMPRHYAVWFTRLYFLTYEGRPGEAAAMIADKGSRPIGIPDWNYDLTATQVNAIASGSRAEVAKTIELWKTESQRGTGFTENAAIFAGFAGDVDEALRLLNGLYFNRGFTLPDIYFAKEQGKYAGVERHTHTLFRRPIAAIRRDPRYGALTRELGLDEYWRRTNSRSLVIA